MKLTMVLADDEAFALKSEEMFIRREFPDIEIVGMAEDGIELKKLLEKLDPDMAMIDIHMPGLTGLEVAELLAHQGKVHTHFIVNTAYSDFDYIKRALNLKTDGYLLKPTKREEKLDTIRRLCLLVEEEKKDREEKETLDGVMPLVNSLLGSELLQSVFSDSCDEAGFRKYCEINHIRFSGGCIVSFLPKGRRKLEKTTADQAVREVLGDLCEYLSTITETGIVLMLLLNQEAEAEDQRSWSEDLAFLVQKKLEMLYGQEFVYGVGDCYPEFSGMPQSYQESVKGFKELLSKENRRAGNENRDKTEFYMKKARQYLQDNFDRDISLSDCAGKIGISPYYLSHLFREMTGETFVEYLSGLRIEAAKRLALQTDLTVRELSERVGYQNTTYFCKVFKRMTGYTIGEFRKRKEENNVSGE